MKEFHARPNRHQNLITKSMFKLLRGWGYKIHTDGIYDPVLGCRVATLHSYGSGFVAQVQDPFLWMRIHG